MATTTITAPQPRTRRDLVLKLLKGAGARGVTTNELLAAGVGSRYSARVLELRERGYGITSERIRNGQWRYTLVREPGWRCTVLHSPDQAARCDAADDEPESPKLFE